MIGLIKQVDAAVASDPEKKTRAFVTFLQEPDDAFKKRLVELAAKEKIAIPLVVLAEPVKAYALADEAYATVLVYDKRKVKKNFALREAELDEKAISQIAEAARFGKAGASPKQY